MNQPIASGLVLGLLGLGSPASPPGCYRPFPSPALPATAAVAPATPAFALPASHQSAPAASPGQLSVRQSAAQQQPAALVRAPAQLPVGRLAQRVGDGAPNDSTLGLFQPVIKIGLVVLLAIIALLTLVLKPVQLLMRWAAARHLRRPRRPGGG